MSDPEPRVMSGEMWRELVNRIAALGELVWDDTVPLDPVVRAEGARYLLRFLAAGIRVCVELDDTATPELGANIENRMSWGLDNPDCNYSYCRLDPGGTYRISGTRGSARLLEFQVTSGHHADGQFATWEAVSELRGSSLEVAADGSFVLTLAAARHEGNWMPLDERASFLLVREFFADWDTEEPAVLLIERLDTEHPPSPLTAGEIAARFDLLATWLDSGSRCWDDFARGILANEPGDIEPFLPPTEASGLGGQAYGHGTFRCEPDQAIILEFDAPDALVWQLALYDRFFETIDFDRRQSSLNSHQSELVGSRFVGVISHDDPGVANWLDPGGHTDGIVAARFVEPTFVPTITYRAVPRDRLDAELPRGVERVTHGERRDLLRRRLLAVQRRYRS